MDKSPNPPKSCCSPSRGTTASAQQGLNAVSEPCRIDCLNRIEIPGGRAFVGTASEGIPNDGEGPLRKRQVKPFLIDATTVTNAEFAAFVNATGYQTEAERIGWSFVFHTFVSKKVSEPVPGLEW